MYSFREDANGCQEAPDSFHPGPCRVDSGQKYRTQEVSARLGYPPSHNLNSLPVFMNCYSMVDGYINLE